ncbi:hypothetical protein CC80DRAFT_521817 [Byssothecium circinans]|uniref:F-box domain-containing protein n=1 Tax=Byssothecium circinans TaxID=147558 RepID=A0A6A5UDU3_9PLEO|nr:hypothetical protein CC80DRAFT_521817 [Byssothecium circinans]
MNNLPQEIVNRISSYLSRDDLKSTLFISSGWQYAAEEYSEAFSEFNLTTTNDSTFLSRYSGHRFRYLKNVKFKTKLPDLGPYDDEIEAEDDCRETANELQKLDQIFTGQIIFLYSTLKALETRLGNVFDMRLGELNTPRKIHLTVYTPFRGNIDWGFCSHRHFVSWRVHLLSPSTLPTVLSVQSLTVHGWDVGSHLSESVEGFRKLDLRVILDLSSKLPNLRSLQCKLGADEWLGSFSSEALRYITHDWEGPRRDSRHGFGKAYKLITLPTTLRHVHLDFLYPLRCVEQIDQPWPALLDPLSTSLHLLSYQLRTMSLHVVADETLFWPSDGETPAWPNLESLNVMFHMSTPSGSWYFRGTHGDGVMEGYDIPDDAYPPLETIERDYDDDSEVVDWQCSWDRLYEASQFRVEPINEMIVPFLTAFAKSAALMSSLREFALWCPLQFSPLHEGDYENYDYHSVSGFTEYGLAWGIAYTKPGEEAFMNAPGTDFSSNRQIWWMVSKWRPQHKLHSLFQRIGLDKHGEGLDEHWGADEATDGLLIHRDWFQDWENRRWDVETY